MVLTTSRRERRTSGLGSAVNTLVCFQRMPKSSSCRHTALAMVRGAPSPFSTVASK